MKITLQKNNDYLSYRLNYKLAGKRIRSFYPTRGAAEAEWIRIKKEIRKQNQIFMRYSEDKRYEMVLAFEAAKRLGINLKVLVDDYERLTAEHARLIALHNPVHTVGELVETFLTEKRDWGNADVSMKSLSSTIRRFTGAVEKEPITVIDRKYITDWLRSGKGADGKPWGTVTKRGYLTDIQTFFNWCAFEKVIQENPAETIRKPKLTKEERAEREDRKEILTVEETEKLMRLCVETCPQLTPRVAILLFAGVRPDEEGKGVVMDDIDFDDRLLLIKGQHAKDRHRRYIPMTDNLIAWLKWSFENGYTLPITNWKRLWNDLRKAANLFKENWPRDAHRHSFASYHLAFHSEKETEKAMGHGTTAMMYQHYRTLVKPSEGRNYFNVYPKSN